MTHVLSPILLHTQSVYSVSVSVLSVYSVSVSVLSVYSV